jgi:SpoVK/Ycf46/Vps4 family AAA+-type ATPase
MWQDHACENVVLDDDQELGVPFISVSAPSIVSGMSGESEKTLRETFEEAKVRYTCFLLESCTLILDLRLFFFFAANSAFLIIHRRD